MPRYWSWVLNAIYLCVLVICSPLVVWAAITKGKYREGHAAKLWGAVPRRQGRAACVWMHAVSVGEVNLLATTICELTARRPELDLVISTTTKTGYDLACRKYGEQHTVFYCPLDFTWAVRRAMRRIRPDVLVLAELELWPNLIGAAKDFGAKVAIINGRLSDNSFRGYARVGWFVRRVLNSVELVAAQDETTGERFRRLGGKSDSVRVTGSLKYDGAETDRANPRTVTLKTLAGFQSDDVVWLAASTQAPEEEMAIRIFRKLSQQHPKLRLVVVPRHPQRFDEVARLLAGLGLPWQRRSELDSPRSLPPSVLLVDTVGELGAWWGTATIGFVGGSFGDRGGQNMIEPAAYGVATCFGPNTWNFRDIVAALIAADAAEVVADEAALRQFVARCLDDPTFAAALGERAKRFVATQLGATARTVDLIEPMLQSSDSSPARAA